MATKTDLQISLASTETEAPALRLRTGIGLRATLRRLSWPLFRKLVYLGGDLLALVLAHMAAVRLVQRFLQLPVAYLSSSEYHRCYIPFFAVVLYFLEGYKSRELRRPERELELGSKAVSFAFLGLMLFNLVVFKLQPSSRYLLVVWFALACVLLLAVRFSLRTVNEHLWRAGLGRRKTVLLGSPAGVAGYRRLLSIQRHHGYEVLGVILDASGTEAQPSLQPVLPVLGSLEQWEGIVRNSGADLLVVAAPALLDGDKLLGGILELSKELHFELELYSSVLANPDLNYERDEFSGCFRFYKRPRWSLALQRTLKRGMDLAIGLIGSTVTLLLTPVVALLLKLEDGGPTFYQREFVGCDGQIHYYRKFRTMRTDADSILRRDPALRARFIQKHKLEGDPRMLRVGRFLRRYSLDEFPQFLSVLIGELTFVGPRVISSEEKGRYGALLPKLLSFKPGVTGFWQVTGRQTTTYEERMQMDMFYIDHWSVWLDLVILGKTFWKVLKAEGAY